ncbi:ABC transporter substrate-binding protein [Micromonospora sp. NPDC005686]|uniref:ABC transporter substrate-binding protein n=1 Tax=unclassified Micromonospora TaxID=2617518 RepID=UPI0033E950D0
MSSLSRRNLLRLGALAGAGGLLAACSRPDGAPAASGGGNSGGPYTTIRSTATSYIWAPFLVAEKKGYFAEEGLQQSGKVAGQGVVANIVLAGDAEFVVGSPMDTMKSTAVGQPLISFCGMVTTLATNIVVSAESFEKAGLSDSSTPEQRGAAMRGMKLASTGVAGTPDLLIRYVSSNLGKLDPNKDLQIVPIQGGGSAMLAAVKNKQIDGMAISSPISDQAISDLGMKYLYDMSKDPVQPLVGFPYIMASCKKDFLEKNPEAIASYCRAIQRSLNFIQAEKDEFRDLLGGIFTDIKPEVFKTAFESNYPIYGKSIVPTPEQYEQAKEFVVTAFEINGSVSEAAAAKKIGFDDTWNATIAKQAFDKVGTSY